jgi:hypothetical protein
MEKFLLKLSRISAYVLIILFILMMISGYRQMGHFTFISRGMANTLHQIYLNVTFLFVGTIHALTAIRRALIRNRIKGTYVDILLIILGILFIGGFSYFTFA